MHMYRQYAPADSDAAQQLECALGQEQGYQAALHVHASSSEALGMAERKGKLGKLCQRSADGAAEAMSNTFLTGSLCTLSPSWKVGT